jgi:hypothetical protein
MADASEKSLEVPERSSDLLSSLAKNVVTLARCA